MISIRQNLTELEQAQSLRALVLDCYLAAINNMAHYAVDLEPAITAPHRKYLSRLAGELADPSPEALNEGRSTLRGLLRDYRDRAANYLDGLRNQLSSTAEALRETVEGLSQSDSDHNDTLRKALARLREVANSAEGIPLGAVVRAVADSIEHSLEQMRKQHQFTVSQLQTEMRLLHNRIDALEIAVSTDTATKFSNRRFLTEYLEALPSDGACFLIVRIRGLAEARARFGQATADDVVATFGRRLRNTIPRDTVVGRWSDQDFLGIVPAASKPADETLIKRFAAHLSMPYACMMGGKVVRIPLVVTAECMSIDPGATAEQTEACLEEAFQLDRE